MEKIESPTTRAYWQLVELGRDDGRSDAQLFALAWLAAARMVVLGQVVGVSSVNQLAETQFWSELIKAGFPQAAYDVLETRRAPAVASEAGRRTSAIAIVVELAKELGKHSWDVLPCLADFGDRHGDAEGAIVPELASLLMAFVGAPEGSEVWIPFDQSGQLTVEALRRGWHVQLASPLATWDVKRQLILAIETGQPMPSSVRTDAERDASGRPVERAMYALVVPPFGMPMKDHRMTMWDITGTRPYEQYARSESWALFEFTNRTDVRAVFAVPQGVLFVKGQEQRLREYLLNRGGERNELQAVVALPPGVFGSTKIAGAVVVMSREGVPNGTFMTDLGSGRRLLSEAGEIVLAGRAQALGEASEDKGRFVGREEVEANECSFAPSRYLRRVADLGEDVVTLGDICEVIRPPVTCKEYTVYGAAEIGQSDLNQWTPIHGELDKTAFLKGLPKPSTFLRSGDVVISIKGTVGRVALVGDVSSERPTVLSQSCLALRLSPERGARTITPEVLVMYLRSPHGHNQLKSLQVGSGVQHISPGTLMTALVIPIPSLETSTQIRRDFATVCELEDQVRRIKHQMNGIAWGRWPDDSF